MRIALQLACLVISLLAVFLFGVLLGESYWQASIHAENTLNGMPLPWVTDFFIHYRFVPLYLMLSGWSLMAGLPFLTRQRDYFETGLFLLRFVLFLLVEGIFLVLAALFAVLPFIPHYSAMLESPVDRRLEIVIAAVCGATVLSVIVGIVRQLIIRPRAV